MATREMIDVMKKLKDLGYYDQVDEGKKAKPDYIDIDGDGNKKEPMKKAVKDKEKKKTNEAKACNCNEDCACGGNCGPNCNCGPDCDKSVKESVNEAITITADSPDDLPALQRIMKLAGMEPVGQDMMPQGDTPDMTMKGDDNINGNCGCEDEAEGYANEPDAQYSTTDDITRLAGLNGLNGSKNPKDLRVKDPAYHEDEQTEEGYANSMGKEKEEEKYSADSLEKQYGKTEIKKLPRKFSMRGDNPLEDIEEALRQDYITFVNESADVKKKNNLSEQQLDEVLFLGPVVYYGLMGVSAIFLATTVINAYDVYMKHGGLPFKWWDEEGWNRATRNGQDPVAVKELNNLQVELLLSILPIGFVGKGAMSFGKVVTKVSGSKNVQQAAQRLGKEVASKSGAVPLDANQIKILKAQLKKIRGMQANKKLIVQDNGYILNPRTGNYIPATIEDFNNPELIKVIMKQLDQPSESMLKSIAKLLGKAVTSPTGATASSAAKPFTNLISPDPDYVSP